MKRLVCMFCLFALILTGCGGGDISQVQTLVGESEIFTQREIEKAMKVAINFFRMEFGGCTLIKIEYDESRSEEEAQDWAEKYDADEAMVLYSTFDVDETGGDGSLNPNSTYYNYQWILTRNKGGRWILQTWGY